MNSHGFGSLKRTLPLTTATAIVIGSVIGSGIFKKTAGMSDVLPSPLLVLGVWVAAGAVTFVGGLCAAELSAAFPDSGGLYAHFRRVMGSFVGFLYGWAVLAVIQTGSIASIAYVFAQYLGYFGKWEIANFSDSGFVFLGVIDIEPLRDIWTKLVAVACIWVITVINIAGVRFGAVVQDVFMYLKVAIMVAIILVATAGSGSFEHLYNPPLIPEVGSLAGAITLAMSGAFWAYDGWINVTYVASEVHNPERNIPKSMALGLFIVTLCYVAVNIAYYYLLPLDVVRSSTLVAADAMAQVLPTAAAFVSAAVVISTFGALNGTAMSSARVHYALARDGFLFDSVARVHPKLGTPYISLMVQGVWSSLLVFSGTFDQVTDMLIFVSWGFYGLLALAVIVARIRFPEHERPYRVPLYPWLPALFTIFSTIYVVLSIMENTRNAFFGGLIVACGLPLWIIWRVRKATCSRPTKFTTIL